MTIPYEVFPTKKEGKYIVHKRVEPLEQNEELNEEAEEQQDKEANDDDEQPTPAPKSKPKPVPKSKPSTQNSGMTIGIENLNLRFLSI